ncbi:hypothetical protein [Polyangium mundeleinium]|uniref:Uncharacterized protein n=1 Tax=Polyangium mundeleinium TaxID=2995306 RepID=A0ABT5ESX6_9BACT|nr:hypothetical protein [Polyangium mundeleinium]MDC0744564.1 hypothetical protein [Polyangium mundeleinium]
MEDPFLTRSYLTMALLREVLAEFAWPAPYELEDDLPDGIIVAFPRSHLYFSDDYLGEVHLRFLTEDTGTDDMLCFGNAMHALVYRPNEGRPPVPMPDLINDTSIEGSTCAVHRTARPRPATGLPTKTAALQVSPAAYASPA